MEPAIETPLHLDLKAFADLIHATSEGLQIPAPLVEKDYYLSVMLRSITKSDYAQRVVFKGGTSLSKAYQLIDRFSEDVDLAVVSDTMSGNQVKIFLSRLMKMIAGGLIEDKSFPGISKGSKYRRQAFSYKAQVGMDVPATPVPSRIIVEISAFANPFPNERRIIEPLVTTFLKRQHLEEVIAQYHLDPFEMNVLSLRQTLCEKTVSLLRFSMSEDPLTSLSAKIRHFYDLHALLSVNEMKEYVGSDDFPKEVMSLVKHDQETFDDPSRWKELRDLHQSPLVNNFDTLWRALTPRYEDNLSAIAYRQIPSPSSIKESFETILRALVRADLT